MDLIYGRYLIELEGTKLQKSYRSNSQDLKNVYKGFPFIPSRCWTQTLNIFIGYWTSLKILQITFQLVKAFLRSVKLDRFSILLSVDCTFLNIYLYQHDQCLKHFKDTKILY